MRFAQIITGRCFASENAALQRIQERLTFEDEYETELRATLELTPLSAVRRRRAQSALGCKARFL
jgi:hypothetical protein